VVYKQGPDYIMWQALAWDFFKYLCITLRDSISQKLCLRKITMLLAPNFSKRKNKTDVWQAISP